MRVAPLRALACCLLALLVSPAPPPVQATRLPVPRTALARGRLLVAAPHLADPNFARSVVLLLAYDEGGGAMGVIVNRPTPLRLASVLPEVTELAGRSDRLWRGGPVMPASLLVLVRSREALDDSEAVLAEVRVLTSREAVLRTLASRLPPERLRAIAGHAGWAPGQLEAELARGDWTVVPATAGLVFSGSPEELWPRLEGRGAGEWTRLRPARHGAHSAPAAPPQGRFARSGGGGGGGSGW